jgi:hypothetical protein
MRIINSTTGKLTFTDFDRGDVGESRGIYEIWNAKASNGIAAGGFIDVLDTEEVMLSAELGQIKKYKTATWIDTRHSMVSEGHTTFTIVTGVNDTFLFTLTGLGAQSVTLPAGVKTAADIVSAINSTVTASGFEAEVVTFFRASNQDNVVNGEVDGLLGTGYGQRTAGIVDGFIALVCNSIITINNGNANKTLGFHNKNFTKVG